MPWSPSVDRALNSGLWTSRLDTFQCHSDKPKTNMLFGQTSCLHLWSIEFEIAFNNSLVHWSRSLWSIYIPNSMAVYRIVSMVSSVNKFDVIEKMSVRCCQSKYVLRRWLWDGRRVCTQRIYGDRTRYDNLLTAVIVNVDM